VARDEAVQGSLRNRVNTARVTLAPFEQLRAPGRVRGLRLDIQQFFETERQRLFRALPLVTQDSLEADDLMREVFVRVWERWDRVGRLGPCREPLT
jgi:Sigma-70 region 2